MTDFFNDMDGEDAGQLEQLSRVIFDLRASRNTLLQQYAVDDAAALLEKIRTGAVAEHPAYDHYLSIAILEDMRETVRNELKNLLPQVKRA